MDQNNANMNSGGGASSPQDNSMVLGIISYLGPLSIISYLMAKDNEFVKFHAKQGLAVFGLEVIVWVLGSMLWSLWMIYQLINLATLILSIIGIVNVVQKKEKALPIIGAFAQGLKI